jgi:subtilase family serine protease
MSVNFLPTIQNNYVSEWTQISGKIPDPSAAYTFFVYLINSEDQLLSDFHSISNPNDSQYGAYLSYNQIKNYSLDPSIIELVKNDIIVNGQIPETSITSLLSGDILQVSSTVSAVEKYFNTKLCYYQLVKKSNGYTPTEEILRVCNPALPLQVSLTFAKYVEYVTPLYFFPYIEAVPERSTQATGEPAPLSAQSLIDYYYGDFTFPSLEETKNLGIKQAFYTPLNFDGTLNPGFGLQDTALFVQNELGYSPSDVQTFLKGDGALELTESASTYLSWQKNAVTEPNLDVAMLLLTGKNIRTMQIADPTTDLFFDVGELPDSVSSSYTNIHQYAVNTSDTFFDQIFSVAEEQPTKTIYDLDLPQVISFSYAWHMNYLDPIMLIRINREIMKLGLMGITFLVSAGDSGSTIGTTGSYGNNDFSSLPAALVIGYSFLASNGTGFQEYLCNYDSSEACYSSGFGCSNIFYRDSYMPFANPVVEQYLNQASVKAFIQSANANKNIVFNPLGRIYPDLTGLGCNFNSIYVQGAPIMGSGSSMAAPVIAGMLSMINYLRRKNGMPFLGYVSQALYQNAGKFPVITGSNSFSNVAGFPFIPNLPYGPSGLGGCNFTNLRSIFKVA